MWDSLLSTTADRPHRRTCSRADFALLLILLITALWHAPARAFCDGFHPVPEFYVGDTNSASPTYDPACTYNDIQLAINAATCSYGTKIFITHSSSYTNQHVTIDNKNVTLIGRAGGDACGPASAVICNQNCPPPVTTPLVSISGGSGAVLSITGTSRVTLRYLDINNGTFSGINYTGGGALTLDTSWVRASQGGSGGGIHFDGTGAAQASLTLLANTQILGNTATASGGGIYLSGNALLTAVEPQILIQGNHADSAFGGGIDIHAASADIGSPGFDGIAVIHDNHAAYGGGIAVTTAQVAGSAALVRLFATDRSQPVGIAGNTATQSGGGIYLLPAAVSDVNPATATLCAWDFRIADNVAQEGAAIQSDFAYSAQLGWYGGNVYLGTCPVADYPSSLGAIPCTNSMLCNGIDGNNADDPASGSAMVIGPGGDFRANRLAMRNNHVAYVIKFFSPTYGGYLLNCLFAQNQTEQELILNEAAVDIGSCTFAGNEITAAHVINSHTGLSISDTIFDEPGKLSLDYSGPAAYLSVSNVLSNDISTLPGAVLGTPQFVDAAGGDYHLVPYSPGVDYAPATPAIPVDLDGNPRSVDLSLANVYGPRDLGAYERQNLFLCGAPDSVFCDGYEH